MPLGSPHSLKDFEKLEFMQRIFKVPKVLGFWFTFEPSLPPEDGQNQK